MCMLGSASRFADAPVFHICPEECEQRTRRLWVRGEARGGRGDGAALSSFTVLLAYIDENCTANITRDDSKQTTEAEHTRTACSRHRDGKKRNGTSGLSN